MTKRQSMSLDALIKKINKSYGDDCFVQASKSEKLNVRKRIETGILSFDLALGGGIPLGTIITLKGEYSSGKSALAHRIALPFNEPVATVVNRLFFGMKLSKTVRSGLLRPSRTYALVSLMLKVLIKTLGLSGSE